jgi:hypothetical protein
VLGGLVIGLSRERPLLDQSSAAYQWSSSVSLTAIALLALDWPELWWRTFLWVLPSVVGTGLIQRWHRRLEISLREPPF